MKRKKYPGKKIYIYNLIPVEKHNIMTFVAHRILIHRRDGVSPYLRPLKIRHDFSRIDEHACFRFVRRFKLSYHRHI